IRMDVNRFSEKTQEAIRAAHALAVRNGQQTIENEHLLLALLEQQGGSAPRVLQKAGLDVNTLKQDVSREVQRMPKVSGTSEQPRVAPRLNRALIKAEDEAKALKDQFASGEVLLLPLLADGGAAGRLLKQAGVSRDKLTAAIAEARGNKPVTSQNQE